MAKKKKTKKETDPNLKLNNALTEKVDAGMAKTEMWAEIWQSGILYFFGEQLEGKKRHKNWDWVVVNYIYPSAMQEIAKLSKNNPKIIVHPWEDNDTEVAETWQSKLQWDWQNGMNKHGMRLEQIAAIMDGKIFGYRVSKVFWEDQDSWDDEKKEWKGEAKHRLWHPAQFWASDDERIDDGDCGTVRYVTLGWAVQRWPDYEEKLEQEAEEIEGGLKSTEGIRGSYSGSGSAAATTAGTFSGGTEKEMMPITSRLVALVTGADRTFGRNVPKKVKIVKIEEIYFKDYESTDEKIEEDIPKEELLLEKKIVLQDGAFFDTQTNKPITPEDWPKRVTKEYKQPKYPNGRYIIRCGKTILNPEEKDQVWPYSRWPFVIVPHYLLPHMWQGSNAIEMYKPMQDMINISVSHLFNNMKMFGDPKIAVENDAIAINPKTGKHYKILSGAGTIIRLVRGGLKRLKIVDPSPPSAGATMLYQLFSQEFQNLTGLHAIARGEREGRMTATEASNLAVSSHDRVALQSVYEDEWIRGIMTLDAEICQRNYSPERFIRIVGEDQTAGVTQITSRMKEIKFDVRIEPSSTLPFDEEKKQARYLQAYQLMADPNPNPLLPDVLRILEIGNWKKLINQHRIWVKWSQFLALYQQVKAGEIEPQAAIQMLIQSAMQEFAQSPQQIGGQGSAGKQQ